MIQSPILAGYPLFTVSAHVFMHYILPFGDVAWRWVSGKSCLLTSPLMSTYCMIMPPSLPLSRCAPLFSMTLPHCISSNTNRGSVALALILPFQVQHLQLCLWRSHCGHPMRHHYTVDRSEINSTHAMMYPNIIALSCLSRDDGLGTHCCCSLRLFRRRMAIFSPGRGQGWDYS